LAFIGINQWRTELKGKAKYELARRVVTLAFQFQDGLDMARDSFTYPGEWAERTSNDNEARNETNIQNEYYARRTRLTPLMQTALELHTVRWEVEIIFGKDVAQLIQVLEVIYRDLDGALWLYFESRLDQIRGESSSEDMRELKKQVYGFPGDVQSQAAHQAVENLVEKLKTHIR
jgi:hypothetical protein